MSKKLRYRIEYYKNKRTNKVPVKNYIDRLSIKYQEKIFSYINKLIEKQGRLKFPYAEHIKNKIWQLRPGPYRIFYFIFTGRRIILLHVYRKKSNKTPSIAKDRALSNYKDFINNKII